MPTLAAKSDLNASIDLSPSLQALAAKGDTRRYRKGTVLIHEGDAGGTLFIILQGRVKVYSTDAQDREITFGSYGAGEFIGEMSLDDGPRSASVMTTEASTCAVVTRHTLSAHIAAHPEFAFELLRKVIGRARLATHTARSLALSNVYTRVTELLNSLATPQSDGAHRIAKRLTQIDMASRVGASREMVSRVMRDLETGGYVRTEGAAWVLVRVLPERW
jgi:CRP/FNR family transcriptional regulator, cyclic AMP receptor protein